MSSELKMQVGKGVNEAEGKVIVQFTEAVLWLQLSPDEADDFADAIKMHARQIRERAAQDREEHTTH